MGNIKLDEKYNILEEKGLYEDDLIDTVDAITRAQTNKKISQPEASFLLNLLLKKEFRKESVILFPIAKQQEISSLFMNLKTKQIKHA